MVPMRPFLHKAFPPFFILAAFAIAFAKTGAWMAERFGGMDSYYGHGYLVPPLFAYLLFRRRAKWLPELEREHRPSLYAGGALFAFALLLHLAGRFFAVFFLSGLALWLVLCASGLILLNARGFWKVRFAFLFLLFMIPLPVLVLDWLTAPLQAMLGHAGLALAGLAGVPAVQSGSELLLSSGPVLLDPSASGIRSLIALLALGALAAHLSPLGGWGKLLLFLSSFPAMLVAGILRVTFLLLFADRFGTARIAPGTAAHDYSGHLLFALAFTLLLLSAQALENRRIAAGPGREEG